MPADKRYTVDTYLHGQLIHLCTVDPKFWPDRIERLSPQQRVEMYLLATRLAYSATSVAAFLHNLELHREDHP